ncbi:hypothetical protein [Priestia megaterium]|uniref:hypothetical protein n=1 Tax=Priestia megaterium TaxID=1404 RepID=UPI001F498361|nr:hypothetical protein [Priestia megaterium]MED3866243.1 hypothetical protein [Priestia megaterium]MED4097845.1 hypothetical protein [Priestia megaterium]MED4141869.1 hypothetical protein [Priestia megaterium]MED4169307.1 hypothetical protein [Priestia megaterium]MED4199814.1 hypothetical protein [Priestia megaterium]
MFIKLSLFTFIIVGLSGCIGEEYDFSPPTVTLSANDVVDVELKETNVDWRGEEGKQYRKETNPRNGINRAKKQQQLTVAPETQGSLRFDSEDFLVNDISSYIISTSNAKQDIRINEQDRTFTFPRKKGNYVYVLELQIDRGYAQYVGNVVIK